MDEAFIDKSFFPIALQPLVQKFAGIKAHYIIKLGEKEETQLRHLMGLYKDETKSNKSVIAKDYYEKTVMH